MDALSRPATAEEAGSRRSRVKRSCGAINDRLTVLNGSELHRMKEDYWERRGHALPARKDIFGIKLMGVE